MRFLGFLIIAFLLVSCEKNISFDLHERPDVLVVDASIENSQPPVVVLTKSIDYFSKISPEILANSFVHNADVRVSNGILTHKLKEYFIDSTGGYKIWFYSIDTANLATAFTGQFNSAYSRRGTGVGGGYQHYGDDPNCVEQRIYNSGDLSDSRTDV